MAMIFEQPEELDKGGGNFVDKPCHCHMLVIEVDENPASKAGEPMDAVKVVLSCLASTDPSQKDRTFNLLMWAPDPHDEKRAKRSSMTRYNFSAATCLIGHHDPGKVTSVETTDAVGRQVVCELGWKQTFNEDKKTFEDTDRIDLKFSNIWHVDDIKVGKISGLKLDTDALAAIPPALRKPVTHSPGGNGTVTRPAAAVTSARGGAVDLSSV